MVTDFLHFIDKQNGILLGNMLSNFFSLIFFLNTENYQTYSKFSFNFYIYLKGRGIIIFYRNHWVGTPHFTEYSNIIILFGIIFTIYKRHNISIYIRKSYITYLSIFVLTIRIITE